MTASRRRFSQEFKDELCQEVISTSKPIREVAEAYGVGSETLRNWLIKYRDAHGGTETELTVTERARLKELERENQELRAETAFLKKAAAFFAKRARGTMAAWLVRHRVRSAAKVSEFSADGYVLDEARSTRTTPVFVR